MTDCWPQAGPERRWRRPATEQECGACRRARKITGYRRIGWLVRRDSKPAIPVPTEKQKLEARLVNVEAEANQLRGLLGDDSGGEEGSHGARDG